MTATLEQASRANFAKLNLLFCFYISLLFELAPCSSLSIIFFFSLIGSYTLNVHSQTLFMGCWSIFVELHVRSVEVQVSLSFLPQTKSMLVRLIVLFSKLPLCVSVSGRLHVLLCMRCEWLQKSRVHPAPYLL